MKVIITGCGGVGSDITDRLVTALLKQKEAGDKTSAIYGGSNLVFKILNTSSGDSNIVNKEDIAVTNIPITKGEGSGSNKSEAIEHITKIIPDIIDPEVTANSKRTLNIVITSLSGGSGNIEAYLLTSELAKLSNTVTVVVGIGTHNSLIAIENMLKSIASFSSLAGSSKKNVTVMLENVIKEDRYTINENGDKNDFVEDINKVKDVAVNSLLHVLYTLCPKSDNLDSADIHNFFNFNSNANSETLNNSTITQLVVNLDKDLVTGNSIININPKALAVLSTVPKSLGNIPRRTSQGTPIIEKQSMVTDDYAESFCGDVKTCVRLEILPVVKELNQCIKYYKEIVVSASKINNKKDEELVELDYGSKNEAGLIL